MKNHPENRSIDDPFEPSMDMDYVPSGRGMPGLLEATEKFTDFYIVSNENKVIEEILIQQKENDFFDYRQVGLRRLHLTNVKIDKFKKTEQIIDHKPKGLWYGINDSWINWCKSEMPGWLCPYIYEIVLNKRYIKVITTVEQLEEFETEYCEFPKPIIGLTPLSNPHNIDYKRLSAAYAGIEIAPYLYQKRLSSMHYYGWDCASGCIWNEVAIKELRLFAKHDKNKGEFVLQD